MAAWWRACASSFSAFSRSARPRASVAARSWSAALVQASASTSPSFCRRMPIAMAATVASARATERTATATVIGVAPLRRRVHVALHVEDRRLDHVVALAREGDHHVVVVLAGERARVGGHEADLEL